jgi:hypothetical protein
MLRCRKGSAAIICIRAISTCDFPQPCVNKKSPSPNSSNACLHSHSVPISQGHLQVQGLQGQRFVHRMVLH